MKDEKTQAVAVRQEQQLTETAESYAVTEKKAEAFFKSGMWPDIKNKEMAIAKIEMGKALGIPAAPSLQVFAIINGRVAMESKGMLAVAANRAGVTWEITRLDAKGCEMIFYRPGFKPIAVSFTEDDARAAGLIGKQNWKMYAEDMYFARASRRGVMRIASDAVLGLSLSTEEADDLSVPALNVVEAVTPAPAPAPATEDPKPSPVEAEPVIFKAEVVPEPAEAEVVEPEPEPEEEEQGDLGDEPEPIRVATDEQKKLIEDGISTLVLNGRNRDELLKKMNAKITQVFGTPKAVKIPDELTYDMAVMLMALIQNTLKKLNGGAKK